MDKNNNDKLLNRKHKRNNNNFDNNKNIYNNNYKSNQNDDNYYSNNFKNNNTKENVNFDSNFSNSPNKLPISNKKDEIIEQINQNHVVIISGKTGCGKSTQVPKFIYGINKDKKILITQPRRIAAISIAKRLSFEMNSKLGELIGYRVSMIKNISNSTKIFVETTGLFLEELLHNNLDYNYIILDEVHERDLYVDLVLALLKDYFKIFPKSDVKLILMSATISENEFVKYLTEINYNNKKVPIIRVEEKLNIHVYKLESILRNLEKMNINSYLMEKIKEEKRIIFGNNNYDLPIFSESLFPVVAAIIDSIERNIKFGKQSGILIFIPGYREIQDLYDYLTNYFFEIENNNLEFLILHSSISDEDQEKVFKYSNKRKIILATNIAESSLTIPNIDFVIDFCLVKQEYFDEDQNISKLELKWCSKANCEQRKGRTGRIRQGTYFQLITEELYNKLQNHQEPEIIRSPLEIPILKLKIYDEKEEPEKILMQTLSPPKQEKIINTLFRLQKIGAIINLEFDLHNKENQMIEEEKDHNDLLNNKKNIIYKSGKITNIGRIFAELNVDIKYSRLIIISFALGQIELGITLAAILSQERSLFLDSNKCPKVKLYESKMYYSFGKNCDFIACYTAYKQFCGKFKKDFINENVEFDTRLKRINSYKYKEIKEYSNNNNLDLKVIKEIIVLENNLKRRLYYLNLYSKHFEDNETSLNFKDSDDNIFILKLILAGTFYDQIFKPEFEKFQSVKNDIKLQKQGIMQKNLYTIIFGGINNEIYIPFIEILENMIKPGKIVEENYTNHKEKLTIQVSDIDSVRKILFVSLKRNNNLAEFTYKSKDKKNGEEKKIHIELNQIPEYLYSLKFYDINESNEIIIDKDSINFTYIISNFKELKKTSFVTDVYSNKVGDKNNKFARYTSILPPIEMFENYMALIFGPKYEMVAKEIKSNSNDNYYSHYIGYQSYKFDNYCISNLDNYNRQNFKNIFIANFIKFDYLFTNFQLMQVNKIRYLINQIINIRFESSDENEVLNKNDFKLIKNEYDEKADEILKEIKYLLNCDKIRFLNDERYEMLYDYIQNYNRNYKYYNNDINENNIIEDENEDEDIKENIQAFEGYINEINKIKSKTKDNDFLQIIDPIKIKDEFFYNKIKIQKKIEKEKRMENMYEEYSKILENMKSLIYKPNAWLCCPNCLDGIVEVKTNHPLQKNKDLGEYIIQGSDITDTFKLCKEGKEYKNKELFEKILEENGFKKGINYENLFCCPKGETIIGYVHNKERYIFKKSELLVRYPNNILEEVKEIEYINNFENIIKKAKEIVKYRETEKFKRSIECKLCGFTIEKDLKEFKDHLKDESHEVNMEELKEKFI